MHLVRYLDADGDTAVGVRRDDGVVPTGHTDLTQFIREGDRALETARHALAHGRAVTPARVLAPLHPGKMLFLGMTYDVFRQDVPEDQEPYVYARVQSSLIGPGDEIRLPSPEAEVLYEGELVVVIGSPTYRVVAADAMAHVFGYTQANDLTWTQWVHGGTASLPQISMSKNADTFCPMGPDVVTADELDPVDLAFTVTVNDEVRTSASTKGMVWDIARILEFLSRDMTLWPGDVVSTGTCEAKPLHVGDLVTVEFDGLGRLENPVAASW